MASSDDKLDLLIAAMSQQAASVQQLVETVGALAQSPAFAGPAAGEPVGGDPGANFVLSTDDPYEPLVPMDESNTQRRVKMAAELGILGTPAGAALLEGGARGFYRGLERDEGQERIELPRDIARRLVEDALLEDPREAADMGSDLLKFWEPEDNDVFAARTPEEFQVVAGKA